MQATNNIAFKEWAVVCAALAGGQQTIILRKGGIDEGREGFRVKHNEFWLLPTWFHQDTSAIVSSAEPLWHETQQNAPAAGKFRISLYAVVQEVFEVRELIKLEPLASEHILSKATIEQRFHYRHAGLFILAVRIYRAPQPFEIDDSSYIAGCKSWVDLPKFYPTSDLIPIIDDVAFVERMKRIRQLTA